MDFNGKTRVCGLLGCPVEHSLSPMMHNCFARRTGLNLAYLPFHTEPERLGEAVRGAYAMNILGLNVTVPHKQAVMAYVKEIDESARVAGAVNTLVRVEGGYKGYNTDVSGLSRAAAENGISAEGRCCILVGAGGAAKAAAYFLAAEGAAKIYCLNRSLEKAQALARHINAAFGRTLLYALALDGWREIPESGCLAIQTTSVGLYPKAGISPIEDSEFFKKADTVMDVIYNPAMTRFMELAARQGAKVVNGEDMLIYQGLKSFELWNPEAEVPKETLEEVRAGIAACLSFGNP